MTTSSRRRTAVIKIYTGDYLDRIRHLEARAEALEKATNEPQLLGEVPEYLEIATEHDEAIAEAEEKATQVTVQAPRRTMWKKLIADHPARSGKDAPDLDEFYGFNVDTMSEALAQVGIIEVHEAGEEPRPWARFSEEEMDEFLDDLGEGDFRRIWQNTAALYRGIAETAGKADLVLRMSQPKDETSN